MINGQYWGAYLMTEHISPGGGGYTDMADRAEILGARKDAIVHKIDTGGQRIRGTNVIPKTDHTLTMAQGDGMRDYLLHLPYQIFSQLRGDHWALYNLDLKVKAKTADGQKMTLVPDLSTAVIGVSGRHINAVALVVEGTNQIAGHVERMDSHEPTVAAEFPHPVGSGQPIRVELNTAYDYQIFDLAMEEDPDALYQWHDLDNVLTYWFVTRLLGGTRENQGRNTYLVMNWEDLGTFLDPTSDDLRPREKYRPILWDCDFCFLPGAPRPIDGEIVRFSGAKELADARESYADMFLPELAPGGVLTGAFYADRFQDYAQTMGKAYEHHGIRWFDDADFGPDYDQILETHVAAKLTNPPWLTDYLLRLDLEIPVQPRFLRGDANHDGAVDMSDAITILNLLFTASDNSTACLFPDACDVNDDGRIDIADPVRLFDWLFQGGAAPTAPFPITGHDPTHDALGN